MFLGASFIHAWSSKSFPVNNTCAMIPLSVNDGGSMRRKFNFLQKRPCLANNNNNKEHYIRQMTVIFCLMNIPSKSYGIIFLRGMSGKGAPLVEWQFLQLSQLFVCLHAVAWMKCSLLYLLISPHHSISLSCGWRRSEGSTIIFFQPMAHFTYLCILSNKIFSELHDRLVWQ